MITFNHTIFFRDFSSRTGLQLTPKNKGALEFLLSSVETDSGFTMIREIAYFLATIRWETAHTFEPLVERRANPLTQQRLYGLQEQYWKTGFYGRGFVQITWEDNYSNAGKKLAGTSVSVDGSAMVIQADSFTKTPDLVLKPPIAYLIAARGMREGWFTEGKQTLNKYITENAPPDYVNARRIINGKDHATDIASFAEKFELLLRAARTA